MLSPPPGAGKPWCPPVRSTPLHAGGRSLPQGSPPGFARRRCVLDIEPGIVVPRDRNDAVRGTQASPAVAGRGRRAPSCGCSPGRRKKTIRSGRRLLTLSTRRRSSASGRTTVPRCVSVIWAMRNPSRPGREAFGANLRAVYADRSTPGRSAPDEECRDACPCCDADPAAVPSIGKNSRPCAAGRSPSMPGTAHMANVMNAVVLSRVTAPATAITAGRASVAAAATMNTRWRRTPRGTPPHAAVMNDVGGRGRRASAGRLSRAAYTFFLLWAQLGERQAAHGPCPAGRGLSGPDQKIVKAGGIRKLIFQLPGDILSVRKDSRDPHTNRLPPRFSGCAPLLRAGRGNRVQGVEIKFRAGSFGIYLANSRGEY